MKSKILELIHSVTLRLPQRIALRNGMRIGTYGRGSNSLFWSVFTSNEYLSFIPFLLRLKVQPKVILDCGAAIGYFSLLVEHLCRVGVFNWKNREYHLIEPMPSNFNRLKSNVDKNLNRCTLYQNVVGKKEGVVDFYFNRLVPWGGSVFKRNNLAKKVSIEYFDVSRLLNKNFSLIKLDIEGSEFDFINTYAKNLNKVVAIILEWHTEFGDRDDALSILNENNFEVVHQSLNKGNRIVELMVRKSFYFNNF
jgi:FkbM family methyltransferase